MTCGSARAAQMHETTLASSHSVQIERTFKWRVARTFNSDALLKARCSRLWSAHNQHRCCCLALQAKCAWQVGCGVVCCMAAR